jgi:hypothetical protein
LGEHTEATIYSAIRFGRGFENYYDFDQSQSIRLLLSLFPTIMANLILDLKRKRSHICCGQRKSLVVFDRSASQPR